MTISCADLTYLHSNRQECIDHSLISNLTTGDPHTQYALLAGRSGFTTWEDIVNRITGVNRFRYLNSIARARRDAVQSILDDTVTSIEFDTEDFDTDGIVDVGGANPSRLVVPITGKYIASGTGSIATNTTGVRACIIKVNGTTEVAVNQQNAPSVAFAMVVCTPPLSLTAGDYLELQVYQNSGGPLNTQTGGRCSLGLVYIGE